MEPYLAVTSRPDAREPGNVRGQAHYFGYIHLSPSRKHMLILTDNWMCDFVSDTRDYRYARSGTHGTHNFVNAWPLQGFTARFRYMGNDGELLEMIFESDDWLSQTTWRPCFWGRRPNCLRAAFIFGVCRCDYFPLSYSVVRTEQNDENPVMAILLANNEQHYESHAT